MLITLTALFAVSAAGNAESAPAKTDGKYSGTTLTYWSMWNASEPQGKVVLEAVKAFEAETGAKIKVEFKGRDINKIILTALEAGENIDFFEDSYQMIGRLYKNYCYDLTDMAAASDYAGRSFKCFNDVVIGWSGFLSCISQQPQVGGVFYNKAIFKAAGVEAPTTWDEFLSLCQTLVDKGYQPMALDSAYANFFLGYQLDRRIGEAVTTDLTTNGGWSKNEGAKAAAEDIIDFIKRGYLADGAPDEYPSSQNKIGLTEKVAMVVCANYVCSEVNNTTGANIDWGMFNYPTISKAKGGSGSTNAFAGANSMAITKYSKNPQASFDFITFLTSGEFDQKMANAAAQIPADPRNTAPAIMTGTIEALQKTSNPLSWAMGLTANSAIKANIKTVASQLFEGKFATGAEFTAAMDALY